MNIDRSGKIRLAVLTGILLILALFTVGYIREIYQSGFNSQIINTKEINDVRVDGGDFSWLFRLFGHGVNFLVWLLVYGSYVLFILIVSLVLTVPFRLIGVRRTTVISSGERRLTKLIFTGIIGVTVMIGLITTRFSMVLPQLLFTAVWSIVILCIYIITTSSHVANDVSNDTAF